MKYFAVLLSFLVLVGCNTTGDQPVDISDVNLNSPYSVGWHITNSELCGYFLGDSASVQKISAVKDLYAGNSRFKNGYDLNHNLINAGGITNLGGCDRSRAVVEAVYSERYPAMTSAASVQIKYGNTRYYLDVSWKNVIRFRDVYPVMVKQEGRVSSVKSFTIAGGKTCDAIFETHNEGKKWEINCTDGTKAGGTLWTRGIGLGFQGSGIDEAGNPIEFLMLPAPAKS
ncbi:hypothetical protein NBZ79_00570 [Sneathiella marina]|uniref:Lipoprotein n=1 Tax=Sneathiella marina TaxID=2950108 RepID=A0ABY4W2R6_9PROT|nr:hypothetical protein [Sneathiella marina]USG61468.1 hypothetical protein NBZ79_00570 [Sneathiella marina]